MAIPTQSGVYNASNNTIYPESNSTWSGLSTRTWDTWNEWAYSTQDTITWFAPLLDFGSIPKTFTLDIETESNATISYQVYTSQLGDFTDAVETLIPAGSTGVTSFTGRTCLIAVIATRIIEMPKISSIVVTSNYVGSLVLNYSQVDTSTLGGTNTNRTLPLGTTVSRVTDVKIMPNEVTSYNLDVYVTNTPTSTYVIPKVMSRGVDAINFALVGVDNQPRDAVVDIVVEALPEQYMVGNYLKTRG
jgi:hypothetical protein